PRPVRRHVLGITAALAGAGIVTGGIMSGTIPVFAQDTAPQTVETPFGRAPLSFADIIDKGKPSVVSIPLGPGRGKGASKGLNQMPEGFPDIPEDSPFYEFFKNLPKEFRNMPRQAPTQAQGSGFVISTDGYVVTNNHVIDGATKIQVSFDD